MPTDVIVKVVFEMIQRVIQLYKDIQEQKIDYASLTPEEIEALLLPKGWISEMCKAADAKAEKEGAE